MRRRHEQIHSKWLRPDVVRSSYRVGIKFNDLESPPSHDAKELEDFASCRGSMNEGQPYQPVRFMRNRQPQKPSPEFLLMPTISRQLGEHPRWQTVRIVQI